MSRILSLSEIYNLPLDIVKGINREWREGVRMHDPKCPNQNIDQYIIRQYPELRDQFDWETLTGNERMALKFGKIKTSTDEYYDGGRYNGDRYDPDLDPFYDEE